ncbi:MAG: hypothetical protein KF820_04490 [Candidatus Paracaedibacteraceae bacterium]|nr:hypothetical protein [Candidatus Paracaedibacteraceae bacterium]
MISRFFSVGLVLSTLSIAGEDGCPVDLTSRTPCSRQASSSLREHLHHSATEEMYPLEEVEQDSEEAAVLYPEEAYDPLPKRTPVEDDQGEDEFNELLAHLQ